MIAAIKLFMKGMVETPFDFMPHGVTALSQRRWCTGGDNGPIVQLELFDDGKRVLLFSMVARDGSGPLRTSFLTMLALEDVFATAQTPYGVCSGEATVTVYRYIDLYEITSESLAKAMVNFGYTAEMVLGGYCGNMPTADLTVSQEAA